MVRKTKLTCKLIHINVNPSKTEKLKLLNSKTRYVNNNKKELKFSLKKLKQNILQYETKFNNIELS